MHDSQATETFLDEKEIGEDFFAALAYSGALRFPRIQRVSELLLRCCLYTLSAKPQPKADNSEKMPEQNTPGYIST